MAAASSLTASADNRHKSLLVWWPVAVGLSALFVPTIDRFTSGIWNEEAHAHGPLVVAVVAWLLWKGRAALLETEDRPLLLTGGVLFMLGLAVYVIGRSQSIPLFEAGSVLPILAGLLLALRGWKSFRLLWFPVMFLLFFVPLPGFVIDGITGSLKQHVSAVAENLLYWAGYPIARNGVVLSIGQYQLLVADACSGLNSMFSLSALGVLYLHLTRRAGWLRNGMFLAAILPIAFCANIIRILILVLVTYYFGDEAGQGFIHEFAGMVLFLSALLLLFGFDGLLGWAGSMRRGRAA